MTTEPQIPEDPRPETMALREKIARIVDPLAWGDLGHDSYLERADEWFAKGRTEPGDPLTDGYRQKANDMVQPSLAKADAILTTLQETTDGR